MTRIKHTKRIRNVIHLIAVLHERTYVNHI